MDSHVHGVMSWGDLVFPLRTWMARTGFVAFVGSNSPVAYARKVEALGPDVYVVNGGRDRGQVGWVPWLEGGLTPSLVIEMLSPSTEGRDRGQKLRIYRDVLKTVDHFLFESTTGGVEYRRLVNGVYVRKHADRNGRFRCASLPLLLGVADGRLRWFERDGTCLPGYDDIATVAEAERARADAERARADAEEAKVTRLIARLRELGVEE